MASRGGYPGRAVVVDPQEVWQAFSQQLTIPILHSSNPPHPSKRQARSWAVSWDRIVGYDDGKLVIKLWDDHQIKPVIDIRNCWRDGEESKLVSATRNGVYRYNGDVSCVCPKTGIVEKRTVSAHPGGKRVAAPGQAAYPRWYAR